jgi:hypothetical protein
MFVCSLVEMAVLNFIVTGYIMHGVPWVSCRCGCFDNFVISNVFCQQQSYREIV